MWFIFGLGVEDEEVVLEPQPLSFCSSCSQTCSLPLLSVHLLPRDSSLIFPSFRFPPGFLFHSLRLFPPPAESLPSPLCSFYSLPLLTFPAFLRSFAAPQKFAAHSFKAALTSSLAPR